MTTISARLKFYIPHADSLKDKRQVCRSLISKAKQKFNASIAEVDTQDIIQTLTIGVAVVSGDGKHAKQMVDEVIRFLEDNTDAELVETDYE